MALTTITHKGKIIYYNDWRNLKDIELFKEKVEEGNENTRLLMQQGKKDILTLTNISGSYVYGELVQLLKEAGKLARGITKKSATVGLTATQRIILNAINTFSKADIKAFNTEEEAKEWLVS